MLQNVVSFPGRHHRFEEFREAARRLAAEKRAASEVVRRLAAMDLATATRFFSDHASLCTGAVVEGLLDAARPLPAWRRDDLTAIAVTLALALEPKAGNVHVAATRARAWNERAAFLLEAARAAEALDAATHARRAAGAHAGLGLDAATAACHRAEALLLLGRRAAARLAAAEAAVIARDFQHAELLARARRLQMGQSLRRWVTTAPASSGGSGHKVDP
ncbi:MAG TPA: hypothetical protein VF618_27730 [Thermoanaerobaculia bacterium]